MQILLDCFVKSAQHVHLCNSTFSGKGNLFPSKACFKIFTLLDNGYGSTEKKILFDFQNAVSSLYTIFIIRNILLLKKKMTTQPKTGVPLNGESRESTLLLPQQINPHSHIGNRADLFQLLMLKGNSECSHSFFKA